jgi:hypothetical protein
MPGRTRSGMQIKMVHWASKLVLAGGRLPRRTIIPLAATASTALPAVASHAIGFADASTESTHLGLAPIEDDGVEQEPGGWPIGAVTTETERVRLARGGTR